MFQDRTEAGRRLADALRDYNRPDPLVLALPRGGLPVAAPVADVLHADLDVLVVRKLGAPGNPEFAIGAVGEDGVIVVDHASRHDLHVTGEQIDHIAATERAEIARRVQAYRDGNRRIGIAARNVIIVDDGLATGSTAAAAVQVARRVGAAHITVAVPVGSDTAVAWLREMADDVVCLETPAPFYAVGQHYRDFRQVDDVDVVAGLRTHPRRETRPLHADARDDDVVVRSSGRGLLGRLTVPSHARGVVVFAHGSGSSHLSPRNAAVASMLHGAGLGTLLFDLLTDDEADVRRHVFDIELLAGRLAEATQWLQGKSGIGALPLGYFGASTGAAAALVAAAQHPELVHAVVSRGGRPDLAGPWLARVTAPTLLIVGGHDLPVIDLNREAQRRLRCPCLLEIVPGATHLFEEPGTLEQAARLAQAWFLEHLPARVSQA